MPRLRAFIAGDGGSVVEFILVAAILLVLFVLALSKAAEVAKQNPCDPPAPSYCRDMGSAPTTNGKGPGKTRGYWLDRFGAKNTSPDERAKSGD